jgi:aminopeptidase N
LASIASAFPSLPLDDQIGIAADSYALAAGGYQSFQPLLALIEKTPTTAAPQLWGYHSARIGGINDTLKEDSQVAAFRAKAIQLLKPQLARVGWEPKAGEPSADALLREELIPTLGDLGDPDVIKQAATYALASLEPNSTVRGAIRSSALQIWAAKADAGVWEKLHQAARTESSPVARQSFYRNLGSAEDPKLAQKALDIALTDEAPVPMRAAIIASVGNAHPALAFDWAVKHAAQVNALLEESTKTGFIVELANQSTDLAVAARVKAYADKALAPESRGDANAVISRIGYLAGLRKRLLPAITAWTK